MLVEEPLEPNDEGECRCSPAKAFDIVDHAILLEILDDLGVGKSTPFAFSSHT